MQWNYDVRFRRLHCLRTNFDRITFVIAYLEVKVNVAPECQMLVA